jgi:integrase
MNYGKGHPKPGFGKRTIQKYKMEGKPFLNPQGIQRILDKYKPSYSLYNSPDKVGLLLLRDQALVSFLFLSCSRINEPLRMKVTQVDLDSDPEFIIIRNYMIEKTKKFDKKGNPKPPFFVAELPITKSKQSILYPFTLNFLDYLKMLPEKQELVFKIKDRRAEQIISGMDPLLFPHYLRACGLTYFQKLIKDPFVVARTFGVRNINTLMNYYGGSWDSIRDKLSL